MEAAALNTVESSALPAVQLILQESSVDNNEEPITEVGVTLDSASYCIEGGLNDGSGTGAGAIAGSRADKKFVTTNSLSELVWSPHKGLRVKCADCSIGEEPSILWGMESSNVVLPPSQSFTDREINNEDKSLDKENPSSSQMAPCFDCQVSDRVNLLSSSPNPIGIMPIRKTISLEQTPGLSRDMEVLTQKREHSVTHIIKEDDHSVMKEKEICDQTDIQMTDGSGSRNMISSIPKPEKAPIPVEVKLGVAHAVAECKKGTISSQFATNGGVGNENDYTAIEASRSQEAPSPILTSPNRKDNKELVSEERNNKIITGASNVPLEKLESTAEDDLQPLKGESKCTQADKVVASEPANDSKQSIRHLEVIITKDEGASLEASPNNNQIFLCQPKGKEKATSNAEVTGKSSGDEDDSHESVESCSSTGLFLERKRPWSYEQQLVCGGKKMKKESCENPDSASLYLRNSSFVNWISNMMKGVCKTHPDERPLALTMRPHHENVNCDQHFDLHGENYQSESSAGFECIFKAMYCPNISTRDAAILPVDHQPKEGSKELELANKTFSDSSAPIACDEDTVKLCKKTVVSTGKSNKEKSENGVGPSGLPNISSKNVSVYHESKPSPSDINNSFNIACGPGTGGLKSYNSSLQNESDSASQGKEEKKFCLTDPNKSVNKISSISGPLGNLWLARFFPKASGDIISPPACNNSSVAIFEDSTDCTRLLPHPLSCRAVKDQSSFEDGRNPSTDVQVDVASKRMQNYAVNATGSFGSLKTTEHTYQKWKPKINLIQHSQRFKGSEAMASVFARRLDALRNIMPSEIADNASQATMTCFFCGLKGHQLRNCLEITGNELEDLLKKVNSFGGAEESSCFCIHCLQFNHWAVACPNKLLRKGSHSDGNSLPNAKNSSKSLHILRSTDLSNNDKKKPLDINSGECFAHTVYDGKELRLGTEIIDGVDCKKRRRDMMTLNGRVSDLKVTKNDLVGSDLWDENPLKNTSKESKSILNQKKIASSSMENESKEDQVSALCNFVNRQIPAVPREIFEVIKKLRLSRTDILKWMKSPLSLFCLEGFFLRLRLRKLEGLEGTGYCVACINGTFREGSEGTEIPLFVNVGGFECLVESRFVSNHEFIEDELMAWWCAILRSGSELPSEEGLRMKLQVRKTYGF